MFTHKRRFVCGRIGMLMAGVVLALGMGTAAQAADNPIRIGVITPLTSTNAVQGEDVLRGIQLAVKRVNNGYAVPMMDGSTQKLGPGLLGGRQVKLLVEDTASRPKAAIDAVRKLINVDNVEIILGAYSSGITVPTGQYSNDNGVIQIGIGSTSPQLAEIGPYFFNLIGTDKLMGQALAEFAYEDSGVKKFTSIVANNPFGVGVEIQSCKRLKELGGECVVTTRYKLKKSDYRPIIQAAFRGDAKAGFFTAYGTEARLILRQMYEMGKTLPKGWYADYPSMWSNEIKEIAVVGEGIKGLRPGPSGDFYQSEYAQAYKKAYGEAPTTAFGPYGYDAAMVAMLAIQKAGKVDAEALQKALQVVADKYKGVTGDTSFDENGMQVSETYQRVIYKNGELVPYEG